MNRMNPWIRVKRLMRILLPLVLMAAAMPLFAQAKSPFPVTLEKQLAERAKNYTEVSLDKNMLGFASRFMDGKDKDEAQAKHLVEKLDGIWVRTYEYDKAN